MINSTSQKKIVLLGGGTGSFVVLSGIKNFPFKITAVVTVTDDGGSTGRLRDEFGFLPVGDARQCIVALSEDQNWLSKLMLYRFEKGVGLKGHNLGNLILTALEDLAGSESKALDLADEIFALRGEVLPVSLDLVKLAAEYQSGRTIISEHKIETHKLTEDRIRKLFTIPEARINPKVEKAIKESDLLILGPGDLYNSTIANLIIEGVPEVIRQSKAKILYIVNLMTLKSQTHGFGAADHLAEIEKYLGKKVDFILINNAPISKDLLEMYKKSDEYPVIDDLGKDPRVMRAKIILKKVIRRNRGDRLKRSLLRHDSDRIAETVLKVLY